jgi:hypothetical protein
MDRRCKLVRSVIATITIVVCRTKSLITVLFAYTIISTPTQVGMSTSNGLPGNVLENYVEHALCVANKYRVLNIFKTALSTIESFKNR